MCGGHEVLIGIEVFWEKQELIETGRLSDWNKSGMTEGGIDGDMIGLNERGIGGFKKRGINWDGYGLSKGNIDKSRTDLSEPGVVEARSGLSEVYVKRERGDLSERGIGGDEWSK